MHPLEKGSRPLDTYHMDHLGPLESTKKVINTYLLSSTHLQKFVWIYTTKFTGTAEVLSHLEKQATIFGNPRRIVSHQGTAFSSGEFREYCREKAIHHHMTTTGVPRANGQIERVNRTVIPLLTKLAAPRPEEWYKYVRIAQQCLNSVLHRSLGNTPFKIMFEVQPRMQGLDGFLDQLPQELVAEFDIERDELRRKAAEQIQKIQQENMKGFNIKLKSSKL